ncbi:MAG: pirin-like C-terminal cupin domain-containing protein [Pseudomonadota bacterium]
MPYDLCNLDEQSDQRELTQVQGEPFAIGAGFDALSFKHTMYAGAMDPLIMVDHFTMTTPTFGPHAHAGLSAVSILFEDSEGVFNNRDSLGNDIDLMPGDLYWLKAGRGAVHDEKPKQGARTHALQVFVNLPARMKYDAPESLHVKATVMPVLVGQGYRARLVLGESNGMKGASSPALPMTILDVNLEAGASFEHQVPSGRSAWIMGVDGAVAIRNSEATANLKSGASVSIQAQEQTQDLIISGNSKAHFVILQAEPLREPFVQRGPFAMSTKKEVEAMFAAHAAGKLGSLDDQ